MERFNNNNQSQATRTSVTHNTEPPTDLTQEKNSAHGFGRSIDKTKLNSHLQSEARNSKNGECLPWATSLLSRAISKTIPQAQLKNQQPSVISMSAGDFKKALKNNEFSGFQGQVMVADDLDLEGLAENTKLPKKLYVQGRLNLTNAKIKKFPSKLYVGGELKIDGCSHFPSGCQSLEVGKNLDLSGNPHIKKLPEQVHVSGSLILNDCKNLKMLCKKLYVGKDLQVRDCYHLKSIPGNMKVAGNLDFTNCVQLLRIPDTVLQRPPEQNTDNERHIYCNGTLIALNNTSQDIADRENTAVHLTKDSRQTLKIILTWMKKNGSFQKPPNLTLTPDEDNDLSSWLNGLHETKEYKKNGKDYRNRIINIVNHIADDREFRNFFFDTQYYSTTSCSNRTTLGVEDFETRVFLSKANRLSEQKSPASERKLMKMGAQMFRLGLLEKYFVNKSWAGAYPIEDMLYFKIHLKDALDLPVKVSHMGGTLFIAANRKDLKDAKKYVRQQSTLENLSRFLQNWEPWQRYHETGRFYIPKYDELTQCPPPDTENQRCPITMETKGDMVCAEGQAYNFDALLKWGRDNSTLPHNPSKTIDWNNIQRWRLDDNLTDNDEVKKL